ncbi:MAG TPA: hypothetical protein DCE41_15380 [Cytophagales bacterium]|nr:hypothetical protein [Cytophagales bacterium]HAA20308.1 hypothetical protein [Cytophagales bacterium]
MCACSPDSVIEEVEPDPIEDPDPEPDPDPDPEPEPTPTDSLSFEFDGQTRYYLLYLPENLADNAPLVMVLHGYTQNVTWAESLGFNALADQYGFGVVYPQGTRDILNNTHWNAQLSYTSVDDLGFLTLLVDSLQTQYSFDQARTFVTGFSNGGFMSYALACAAAGTFRAIAPVAGVMSGITWQTCDPDPTVPVLHIHGTADEVVPDTGLEPDVAGWGGAPPLDSMMTFWVLQNACNQTDTVSIDDATTAFFSKDCVDSLEVHRYSLEGWEHIWPSMEEGASFNATELIWEFFQKY